MQNPVGQQNIQQNIVPGNNQYQSTVSQPQNSQVQQYVSPQTISPQAQNLQVPNYSGVNIQIFNPTVTTPGATAPVYNVNSPNYGTNPVNGCYPSGYYTNNWANPSNNNNSNSNVSNTSKNITETTTKNEKKTEKREIVQLTDDYIRNLENYLNSQNKDVRLMGAKEVVARLEEDKSRKDDKALNALINKMLQDPYSPVKVLAMSALDSRIVTGDDFTVGVLQKMQQNPNTDRQEAVDASGILLKMSGRQVEKEFEVKDKPKTEKKESK